MFKAIDDLKLLPKTEKELKKPMRIYSQDIGIEFGIEKFVMVIRVKKQITEGIKLPNQERVNYIKAKVDNKQRKESVDYMVIATKSLIKQ